MRSVIFANGDLRDPEEARELLRPEDRIIAVNGGTRHALAAGVVPHLIIGDLDSLSVPDRALVEAMGTLIIAYPARKDETDLELALRHAADTGSTSVIVLAALGGRLDQTVANLLLLASPELQGVDVRIVDGEQTAFLIQEGDGDVTIAGRPGDTVSLIPLGGDAAGVSAEGLEWPLRDETLHFGPARGVSNVLVAEQALVHVRRGKLLCVVTRTGAAV